MKRTVGHRAEEKAKDDDPLASLVPMPHMVSDS